MKKILIVDDEKSLLKSISTNLSKSNNNFKIFTAINGTMAIETLKIHKIDLLITDLKMPVMDGFELIIYMINNYKDIPIIVMTAYGASKSEKYLKDIGIISYLEKPFDIKDFRKKIIESLTNNTEKIVGYISAVAIPSFLQLVQFGKMTYTIKIISQDNIGFFYFIDGEILNAKNKKKEGVEAFNEIINWINVRIELKKKCDNKERIIKTSLTHLLLNAMQIKDKSKKKLSNNIFKNGKKKIDVHKVQESIQILKRDIGEGLVETDIWSIVDVQSIAAYNGNLKDVALFDQIINHMIKALNDSAFPSIGKYFILELEDNKILILIPLRDYRWGILIDKEKIQLGLILNVILPKGINTFKEVLRID